MGRFNVINFDELSVFISIAIDNLGVDEGAEDVLDELQSLLSEAKFNRSKDFSYDVAEMLSRLYGDFINDESGDYSLAQSIHKRLKD